MQSATADNGDFSCFVVAESPDSNSASITKNSLALSSETEVESSSASVKCYWNRTALHVLSTPRYHDNGREKWIQVA